MPRASISRTAQTTPSKSGLVTIRINVSVYFFLQKKYVDVLKPLAYLPG
jgi:hypothetical protein